MAQLLHEQQQILVSPSKSKKQAGKARKCESLPFLPSSWQLPAPS
jgi:hypothetical protein